MGVRGGKHWGGVVYSSRLRVRLPRSVLVRVWE